MCSVELDDKSAKNIRKRSGGRQSMSSLIGQKSCAKLYTRTSFFFVVEIYNIAVRGVAFLLFWEREKESYERGLTRNVFSGYREEVSKERFLHRYI